MALSGSTEALTFSFDNVLPGKYKGQERSKGPDVRSVIHSISAIALQLMFALSHSRVNKLCKDGARVLTGRPSAIRHF